MFKLSNIQKEGLVFLELKCSEGNSEARICLNQGARLDQLICNCIEIVSEVDPLTYKHNYASAILFPFANRLNNGKYKFNNSNYKLDCNEVGNENALHGLVFDKTFKYVESNLNSNFGSVTLRYDENEKSKGFPFKYKIELVYKLSKNAISLTVHILNTGSKVFPFTLGWHPYFKTKDLYNSYLNFKSNTLFSVDNHQIPNGEVAFNETMPFQLKDKKIDTGYKLEDNQVEFLTPEYRLQLKSSSIENYLQVYTPRTVSSLAIEPMTGAADSFNNKMGLQTLSPKDNYTVEWTIAIENSLLNTTNTLN